MPTNMPTTSTALRRPGLNLLGFALMEARQQLAKHKETET